MSLLKDSELVQQAKNGDIDAFEELYRRHCRGVRIEAARIQGSADEEDVAQEAFLRAFQKISTLRPPYVFGSWVRQIARNIARNNVIRSPRMVPLQRDNLIETDDQPHTEESELKESVTRIITALSRLSPKLREAARLSYLSRRTNKQIAERLRIPLGTVKSRLWDARSRIKKEVGKVDYTSDRDSSSTLVPEIGIRALGEMNMSVESRGPGLYFGSVMAPGHRETCKFYDYPKGILTQTVHTQVVREVEISGRPCFEVLIEHSDCEPSEPNVLDYFRKSEQGFHWVMRTVADASYPQTRFMDEQSELFDSRFEAGEHGVYSAKVVDLTIGSIGYGRCLAVFWAWEKGTPAESFYTVDGRQVLHRRYVGPDAPKSGAYDYSKLDKEHSNNFKGVEYRLWYDTVLCP